MKYIWHEVLVLILCFSASLPIKVKNHDDKVPYEKNTQGWYIDTKLGASVNNLGPGMICDVYYSFPIYNSPGSFRLLNMILTQGKISQVKKGEDSG